MEGIEKRNKVVEWFLSNDRLDLLITISIKIALIYILLIILVYVERRLFKKAIEQHKKRSVDSTNLIFFRNIAIYTTYAIGFLSMLNLIPGMEKLAKTAVAGAGILAAAVGFGSQQAISNIMSGIFMVMFKPFRVGDFIDLGNGNTGTVVDISLRHTTIKNIENRMIIVPNSVLNNQPIVNSSIVVTDTCAFVNVSIGYGSDINRAMTIIQEEVLKHPLLIDQRTEDDKKNGTPQVLIKVIEWANSSINLRAWAWAANSGDAFTMKCDLLKSIKERFDLEGIEIPFPYTNVILKKE